MSDHTPGPWRATLADEWRSANGNHVQFGSIYISAGRNNPDSRYYYRIGSVSNVNNLPQNQANAKLIAAAPDLLDALQQLDEAYCRAGPNLTAEERRQDRMRLIAARTAIAKATGRQQ